MCNTHTEAISLANQLISDAIISPIERTRFTNSSCLFVFLVSTADEIFYRIGAQRFPARASHYDRTSRHPPDDHRHVCHRTRDDAHAIDGERESVDSLYNFSEASIHDDDQPDALRMEVHRDAEAEGNEFDQVEVAHQVLSYVTFNKGSDQVDDGAASVAFTNVSALRKRLGVAINTVDASVEDGEQFTMGSETIADMRAMHAPNTTDWKEGRINDVYSRRWWRSGGSKSLRRLFGRKKVKRFADREDG